MHYFDWIMPAAAPLSATILTVGHGAMPAKQQLSLHDHTRHSHKFSQKATAPAMAASTLTSQGLADLLLCPLPLALQILQTGLGPSQRDVANNARAPRSLHPYSTTPPAHASPMPYLVTTVRRAQVHVCALVWQDAGQGVSHKLLVTQLLCLGYALPGTLAGNGAASCS
jgi:hypothetical protein